jgi:hypothetical protein
VRRFTKLSDCGKSKVDDDVLDNLNFGFASDVGVKTTLKM